MRHACLVPAGPMQIPRLCDVMPGPCPCRSQEAHASQEERTAAEERLEAVQADKESLQQQIAALGHAQQESMQELEDVQRDRDELAVRVAGLEAAEAAAAGQKSQQSELAERLRQQVRRRHVSAVGQRREIEKCVHPGMLGGLLVKPWLALADVMASPSATCAASCARSSGKLNECRFA